MREQGFLSAAARAVPLRATLGPLGSSAVVSRLEGEIQQLARNYELVATPLALEAAAQLRSFLDEARMAARLWTRLQASRGSGEVSSDRPETAPASGFQCPPSDADLRAWWSVSEVATKLNVSDRQVTRMCVKGESFVATRSSSRGRPWRIEPNSVVEHLEQRRRR